jgi:hypothetical protein
VKYWSEVDGRYIEGESVVFTGPLATHTLVGDYQQKESPHVTKSGKENGQYVTKADLTGKANADLPFAPRGTDTGTGCKCIACGCWIYGIVASKCARCRRKTHGQAKKEPCKGCGTMVWAKQLTKLLRLCQGCKGKGARRKVAA